LCIFSIFGVSAQSPNEFNLYSIFAQTKDSNSVTFYPKLANRFVNNDTTLTQNDYLLLYYGFAYQKAYSPLSSNTDTLNKLHKINENSKIVVFCDSILKSNPTNLIALFFKRNAVHSLYGDNEQYITIKYKLEKLLNAILATGDGKSTESGIYVTNVRDEYFLMEHVFNVWDIRSQQLIDYCDVFNTQTNNGDKQIVFNADIILNYWSRIFKKHSNKLFNQRQVAGYDYLRSFTCLSAVISDNFKYISIYNKRNKIKIYNLENWNLLIDTVIIAKSELRPDISYFVEDSNYFVAANWVNYHRGKTIDWRINLKTGEIKKFKNKSDNLKEGLVNRNDKFLSETLFIFKLL